MSIESGTFIAHLFININIQLTCFSASYKISKSQRLAFTYVIDGSDGESVLVTNMKIIKHILMLVCWELMYFIYKLRLMVWEWEKRKEV